MSSKSSGPPSDAGTELYQEESGLDQEDLRKLTVPQKNQMDGCL